MRSGRGDGQLRPPGFPIRTSSDHSLVADSPRLIAGSNVLHRLLVPRHPPCALKNLATSHCRCTTKNTTYMVSNLQEEDARVHCAVLKIRAVPALRRYIHTAIMLAQSEVAASASRHSMSCDIAPVSSGPNSVLGRSDRPAASVPFPRCFKSTSGGRTSQA